MTSFITSTLFDIAIVVLETALAIKTIQSVAEELVSTNVAELHFSLLLFTNIMLLIIASLQTTNALEDRVFKCHVAHCFCCINSRIRIRTELLK
ncbi:hypothetical protein D3C87_1574990 [compost metagenome]